MAGSLGLPATRKLLGCNHHGAYLQLSFHHVKWAAKNGTDNTREGCRHDRPMKYHGVIQIITSGGGCILRFFPKDDE